MNLWLHSKQKNLQMSESGLSIILTMTLCGFIVGFMIIFTTMLIVVLYLAVGVLRMEISAEWAPPLYYSTARFLMPAIIPVVLLGLAGMDLLTSKRISRFVIATLVVSVFIANTWMLLRVELPYFNCTSEPRWTCTDL